jgi:ubiquitin-protein ligase
MTTERLTKVLMAQYSRFLKDPHPNLVAQIDEQDVRIWYFLIYGVDEPFKEGEFIFRLVASNEFPHKPPSFDFITPNGVYETGGKICISISEFHNQNWRPSLGMAGFATQVYNGLVCFNELGHGIRILQTNKFEKKSLAFESKTFNMCKFNTIYQRFLPLPTPQQPMPPQPPTQEEELMNLLKELGLV